MHVGERDDFARDRAIAGEAGERRLSGDLILGRLVERGAQAAHPDRFFRGWLGNQLEARKLDSSALDLAAQIDRLAEQARRFVTAAAQLARKHRLGLGEAGTNHELGGGEDLRQIGRIAGFFQQQVDIGPKDIGKAWRQIVRVGLRADDLVEHFLGLGGLAGPRQIAGEAGLSAEQGGRAGIAGFDQDDALAIETVGLGEVFRILRDSGEVAKDLGAHPHH